MSTTETRTEVTMAQAAEVMLYLLKVAPLAKLPRVCSAKVDYSYSANAITVRLQLGCAPGMGSAGPEVGDPIIWAAVHAWGRYLESPPVLKDPVNDYRMACVETVIDGVQVQVWDHVAASFERPEVAAR